ncbi:unnamed protein product, partial [Ectocarpus fasciculatus]
MLVGFQMDQAKLGKETQAALREKEDEAKHWKKLYVKATGGEEDGEDGGGGGGNPETGDDGEGAGGALGVDMLVKLEAEVDVLRSVNLEWEDKLKEALRTSTEEAAARLKLEHENSVLSAKVKELDTARSASEDLILELSKEKSRMLGSSGEASDTIESLVDEYSRLASEHTAQRQMDNETIQRLENVRDELVEKLKAHETNIMQLLQRAEEDGAVSQQMSERDVADKAGAPPESGEAPPSAEEIEKRLEEQAAKLRAENEAVVAELRQKLEAENAEESASALSVAAEGHAAAMQRAVNESAAAAGVRAAAELEAALKEAKEAAEVEKARAAEEAAKEKEAEKEVEVGKLAEELEAGKAKALEELKKRLEEEKAGAMADAASKQ